MKNRMQKPERLANTLIMCLPQATLPPPHWGGKIRGEWEPRVLRYILSVPFRRDKHGQRKIYTALAAKLLDDLWLSFT